MSESAKKSLPLWQRLLLTFIVIIAISVAVGLFWRLLFGFALPSYASGIIGGLVAVPVWEFLKRIKPSGGGQ